MLHEVVVRAPVNIALVKYWGKRDRDNLPINSSLSISLSSETLGTTTKLVRGTGFVETILWLNGIRVIPIPDRVVVVVKEAQRVAGVDEYLEIYSINDGPTASGLASSASGFAALAYGLIKLYDLDKTVHYDELVYLARLGSGSAIRSMYPGFVLWDTETGYSHQLTSPISHNLFDLQILCLVLNAEKKDVLSTVGMARTLATSDLLSSRLGCVPERISSMISALACNDFPQLCTLIIKDSNQFHAVCMDTYPPILYLNDSSRFWISLVHYWNTLHTTSTLISPIAYTFDAGPNPVLIFNNPQSLGLFIASVQNTYPTLLPKLPSTISTIATTVTTSVHIVHPAPTHVVNMVFHCTLDLSGPKQLK